MNKKAAIHSSPKNKTLKMEEACQKAANNADCGSHGKRSIRRDLFKGRKISNEKKYLKIHMLKFTEYATSCII
jgi:hypothetical protein